MSSLAEVYAKDLGVKITKPFITDHYFPLTSTKYVCIDFQTKVPSQQYEYWAIVDKLLKPYFLDQNIDTIQIPDLITNKQKNFIIKNSLGYLGIYNHFVNIADVYEKPSVSILSHLYEKNVNFFKKAKIITPDFSKIKPSFADQENIKRIDEIKPEQIAQSVLDGLNIKEKIKFKTVKAGSNYKNNVVEIKPNFFAHSDDLVGKPINVRGDLHFDLPNICNWCSMCVVNLYISDFFDINVLKSMPNLKQIVFQYNKEHEKFDLSSFFKNLKNKKVNIIIQTKDPEILSDLRLKYFDYNVILEKEFSDTSNEIPDNCKYLSNKKFISKAEVYASEFAAQELDKSDNFIYDDISKLEIENFYIYEEK